jgi:predicted GNAT superfamily acetyltransferase
MAAKNEIELRILHKPEELRAVEKLQETVWPGAPPAADHVLIAAGHNGGINIGAYDQGKLVGAVFGFVGISQHDEQTALKHCSHILGVLPEYRDKGVGFMLKQAQRLVVQKQGIQLVTWTYDPLESRNAYLNIHKLGAICKHYRRNEYGDMIDELNQGMPSDRFEVEWWVNSGRVSQRIDGAKREKLTLEHYTAGDVRPINATKLSKEGWPVPHQDQMDLIEDQFNRPAITLLEFPADFQAMRAADIELAKDWRMYTRVLFELFFAHGYVVTDMLFEPGDPPRSYYVLSFGEATIG